MAYVDGFVLPVPKKNINAYKKMAKLAGKIWMEHGALQYVECIADDVPEGKKTSFPMSVKLKKDEVVVFSYVIYKSKAERKKTMKKVMKDPRMIKMMDPATFPVDGSRMIWGGFKEIVSL